VVAPFDQEYEVPVVAVKLTFCPWQIAVGPFATIEAVGIAFTATVVACDVALHPEGEVMVTL
jgi:hypothetical protein